MPQVGGGKNFKVFIFSIRPKKLLRLVINLFRDEFPIHDSKYVGKNFGFRARAHKRAKPSKIELLPQFLR